MIQAAELPLNDRGAVYHLDLLPEELANVIITVGDPARVPQISQHFDRIHIRRSHREFVTHTGYIGTQQVSVLSTGIGVPNIDIVLNELDALANIDLDRRTINKKTKSLPIIRFGTTGGLQPTCKPGDIIVTRFAIGFGTLLNYYQNTYPPLLQQMYDKLLAHLAGQSGSFYLSEADKSLLDHFSPLGRVGITATCSGFYGPQGRLLRIPLRYPELLDRLTSFRFQNMSITNFEMESAGILALGGLLGHRCISLSVVVANRIKGLFADNVRSTIDGLIVKVLEQISCLPDKPQ